MKNNLYYFCEIMGKFLTLNEKHNSILMKYLSKVDGFIYDITEHQPVQKWRMFQPLKKEAIRLHNELGRDIDETENPIGQTEWVFMLPNFLLFGCIGFATALKEPENYDDINIEIEHLYANMSTTIMELDEMLCEHKEISDRKKTKLKTKQKTK